MKFILPLLALTLSIPAFADQSDFERGYNVGAATCSAPTTITICTTPQTRAYGPASATGRTKAEAIGKISAEAISYVVSESKQIGCTVLAQ